MVEHEIYDSRVYTREQATVAKPKPNLVQRYPWLPIVSGAALIIFVVFYFTQQAAFKRAIEVHQATLQDIATKRPTSGTYTITGGRLDYVWAQAVDFANDPEKDAGTVYDSYVPYVDSARRTVILVKIPNYSPAQLRAHIDDPPESITGYFEDPSTVPAEIFQRFANQQHTVPTDIPVMEQFGGPSLEGMKARIWIVGILLLLAGSAPWGIMYLISRPKKKKKRFSDRYPERRIY